MTWKQNLEEKLRKREYGNDAIVQLLEYASNVRYYTKLSRTDNKYLEQAKVYSKLYVALLREEEERVKIMKERKVWRGDYMLLLYVPLEEMIRRYLA